MRALREPRHAVGLERVADVLMTQMNLIAGVRAARRRSPSFHAQYVCPACGAEAAPLVDAVAHVERCAGCRRRGCRAPSAARRWSSADFPERYLTIFKPEV